MVHSGHPFEPKFMSTFAVFGGGCFWCTEAVLKMLKGVVGVEPGYAGGSVPNPTYEQVSAGDTGHAEVVRIEFDPTVISYDDLLAVFFATHDPTTLNRQGADVGTQYRSIILYADDAQQAAAIRFIGALEESAPAADPIVTEVKPLAEFFPAEDYHKNYYERNPNAGYCQVVITPKVKKAKELFAALLNASAEDGAEA